MSVRFKWTDDRDKKAVDWWNAGLSATDIEMELKQLSCGTEQVTRSAVIGRLTRLRNRGVEVKRGGSVPRRLGVKVQKPARPKTRIVVQKAIVSAPRPEPVNPHKSFGVSCGIMELAPASCRWPIGDGFPDEYLFCNAVRSDGLPYCDGHAQLAYDASKLKRARERKQIDTTNWRAFR